MSVRQSISNTRTIFYTIHDVSNHQLPGAWVQNGESVVIFSVELHSIGYDPVNRVLVKVFSPHYIFVSDIIFQAYR